MKAEDIKITPKWNKSKDEIWNEIFEELEEPKTASKVKQLLFWRYAVAAVVIIMIVSGTFACLYRETIQVVRGTQQAVVLPDGSKVKLNAESELTYKPYWWFVSRNVELKGEAFFEVMPGSQFTVKSLQNKVRVLGTSFNVFARQERYSVTCLTGKVEVEVNENEILLTPDMQLIFRNNKLKVLDKTDGMRSIGWTQSKFSFIGVPLADVISEIERQYDIRVITSSDLDYLYTGNFSKERSPEEILEIVGRPFGIIFKIEP